MIVAAGVLTGVVALVPPVLLGRLAAHAARTASRGEVPPPASAAPLPGAVATPLFSARRVPGIVTGQLRTSDLVAALAALGSRLNGASCLHVDLDGQPVSAVGDDRAVLPASNLKLVTAAVALDRLGRDYRFTTALVGSPPVDGVVEGDAYLVGGGDPVLRTDAFLQAVEEIGHPLYPEDPGTRYDGLVEAVSSNGITQITGRILADDSRYDDQRFVPTWPDSYRTSHEAGPLGALVVDDGYIDVHAGTVADDPALQAARALTDMLHERGVAVGGAAGRGSPATDSGSTTIAAVQSPPLVDIVREMLTMSDDNTAELLLKELGHAKGDGGTTEAGLAVVRDTLAGWGIPLDGIKLTDGSGLDRGNRVRCPLLVAMLERGGPGNDIIGGLGVAGRTGTMAQYFTNDAMTGKLKGKTGTLTGARALSGALTADDGHTITFSLVYNGPDNNAALALWEQLGQALATYPSHPDLAPYEPLPAVPG